MALIKKASKKGVTSVWEDDRSGAGNNYIYIEGEGHNKTTLAPVFNTSAVFKNGSSSKTDYEITTAGATYTNYSTGDAGYSTGGPRAGMMGCMHLTKPVAHDHKVTTTGNDGRNNIDTSHIKSLDPSNTSGPYKRFVAADGSTNSIRMFSTRPVYSWYQVRSEPNKTDGQLYHEYVGGEVAASSGGTTSNNTTIDGIQVPACLGDGDSRISMISFEWRTSYMNRPMEGVGHIDFDDPDSSTQANRTQRSYYFVQLIGRSTQDDKPIYLYNNSANEYTQYITKHNVSADSTTDLHTFNTVPSTSNTLYGGARGYTTIGKTLNYSSTWFPKYNDSDTKVFYTPYFDANYDYHPFVFEWDTTADTFTRGQADNIADASSARFSGQISISQSNAGHSSVIWNETFKNSGNRYLSVIPMSSSYQSADSTNDARTIISYAVSSTDATALTFHSEVEVPKTIRNAVFLNDARTILGVICYDVFYTYAWNNTTGWVRTGTIPGRFHAVGRDSTDRIWGIEGNNGNWMDVHVFTPNTPISITVTPASSTYNYTGTTISSTVDISAFDINGDRIATDINLTIDGSTMTFGDDTTSTTVTTSSSGETSQAIKITGAGLSDIVANVSL